MGCGDCLTWKGKSALVENCYQCVIGAVANEISEWRGKKVKPIVISSSLGLGFTVLGMSKFLDMTVDGAVLTCKGFSMRQQVLEERDRIVSGYDLMKKGIRRAAIGLTGMALCATLAQNLFKVAYDNW